MNSKSTKRALLGSVVAMFVCFTMLLSTTFAWFTDTAVSADNKIVSGTLKIDLEMLINNNDNSSWVSIKESKAPIFDYDKWEPGYTDIKILKVENEGNLALNWHTKIVFSSNLSKLADVIDVYILLSSTPIPVSADKNLTGYTKVGTITEFVNTIEGLVRGTLKPQEDAYLAIALKMQDPIEKEYQDIVLGTFDIMLIATQETYEKDSFDDQYDADATLPGKFFITNDEELDQAMATGGQGVVVNDIYGVCAQLNQDKKLTLNLNGKTLTGTEDDYVIVNNGNLAITGNGEIYSNLYGSIENWGTLFVDDLTLNVSGSKYGFHCKDGEVVINGISLIAQRGGLNIQGGKVTINSGSITTTAYGTNIGYLVYAGGTSEVIINGGDFRYDGSYYRHGVLYAGNNASISVYGGTFGKGGSNVAKKPWLQTADNGTITIYGGSFEFDPSAFVAEGYEAVKGADGWWRVSKVAG